MLLLSIRASILPLRPSMGVAERRQKKIRKKEKKLAHIPHISPVANTIFIFRNPQLPIDRDPSREELAILFSNKLVILFSNTKGCADLATRRAAVNLPRRILNAMKPADT